jgi:hypothetical protein
MLDNLSRQILKAFFKARFCENEEILSFLRKMKKYSLTLDNPINQLLQGYTGGLLHEQMLYILEFM